MEWTFSERADGHVDAHIEPSLRLFNEALQDSISSLPPRGARGKGPSTYWIDVAERGARRAAAKGDERPFTCGNITQLQVVSGRVVASYDFAGPDEPVDSVSLDDFLSLLAAWRTRVIERAAKSTTRFPQTYRRNRMGWPR